jgi:sec-independent protein translocase protein TatB
MAQLAEWPVLPVPHYHSYMNLGFSEMVFLFILALLIFGPKKLPEIGRQIGRFMNEFKRASNEFRSQIESEINALDVDIKPQILPPLRAPLDSLASRIFNPPSAERLEAAAPAPAAEPTPAPEPPPAPKVAPDA